VATEHNAILDPEIHEPKGVATAINNTVYTANGAGSGVWQAVVIPNTFTFTAQTTAYAAVAGDFVGVTTGASAVTVTLPAAASNLDKQIIIKKTDAGAGAVTIDGNASELIDGAATQSLPTQYDSMTVHCDGTGWHVV